MKLENCKIDFLISSDITRIKLIDSTSGIAFFEGTLTPEQLSRILSREVRVCMESAEVFNLKNVGKKKETKGFIFEVPNFMKREEIVKLAEEKCPEGWEISTYFGSQDSFYHKDDKKYARTHIYRWV